MADHTKIEWTDATWNPITGCSVLSPGCTNCYAMKLAGTRMKHHESRAGLTVDTKAGPVWNGEVRFNEQWLTQPLHWKKPRMIFVCAHADLFHESVPDTWIDRVFAVMALAPQHTFQVLTKRSKRMREYLSRPLEQHASLVKLFANPSELASGLNDLERARALLPFIAPYGEPKGALPNVWLGVSVEDQKRADERIPDLLATPAAVRWISAEPLLGPVELHNLPNGPNGRVKALTGETLVSYGNGDGDYDPEGPRLDWVVVGGESGPNARPMHPDWARSLRDQCAAAGVPFLFKQWGAFLPAGQIGSETGLWQPDMDNPPPLLTTKKNAGRLLDGVEHNGYPQVQA